MNIFEILPHELIVFEIFQFLEVKNVLKVSITSKKVQSLANNEMTWNRLVMREIKPRIVQKLSILFEELLENENWKEIFKIIWVNCPLVQNSFKRIEDEYNKRISKLFGVQLVGKYLKSVFKHIEPKSIKKLLKLPKNDFFEVISAIQKIRPKKMFFLGENKVKYIGGYVDGKMEGNGTLYRYPLDHEDSKYVGEFKQDLPHGKGFANFPEMGSYKGMFKKGKFHGYGQFDYAGGGKYVGFWQDDFREGKGKFCYSKGGSYEGNWKANEKSGIGVLQYPNGSRYEGEFSDDHMEGRGTFYYANKSVYQGQWHNGKQHGLGKTFYACGVQYEGQHINGAECGRGKFIYKKGVYKGEFKDDRFEGNGKLISHSNNLVFDGDWHYIYEGNRYFEGIVSNLTTLERFEGKWQNGYCSKYPDLIFHIGFFCSKCQSVPIFGRVRYECKNCVELTGYFLCGKCFENHEHDKTHEFIKTDIFTMNEKLKNNQKKLVENK